MGPSTTTDLRSCGHASPLCRPELDAGDELLIQRLVVLSVTNGVLGAPVDPTRWETDGNAAEPVKVAYASPLLRIRS